MKFPRIPARPQRDRAQQRGMALAVVMVIMVVLTMFGIMILMQTNTNMVLSRYERETAACRTAAEAATRVGINDAMTQYRPTGGFTTLLNCSSNPNCPPVNGPSPKTYMAGQFIPDYPGNPYNATWTNLVFSGNGAGDPRTIYVTIYARNNYTDANPTTDRDNQVVVVGEAVMTENGAVPAANRSNVRVRKLIAAEIRPPRVSTGGGSSHSGSGGGTGYGT